MMRRLFIAAALLVLFGWVISAQGKSNKTPGLVTSIDSSLIHQVSATLDDAQIRALPFELIPAPGTGKTLIIVHAMNDYAFTADYDDPPHVAIVTPDNYQLLFDLGYFTTTNQNPYQTLVRSDSWFLLGAIRSQLENQPALLNTQNGAPITGGDPANTWKHSALFFVWSRTLGKFLTVTESGWDEDTRTFQ